MRTRKAYDSTVVFLYATGRENILPLKFRRKIPYSTICSWRKTDYSKFIGSEFRKILLSAFDHLQAQTQLSESKSAWYTIIRTWLNLRSILKDTIKEAGNNKSTQRKVLDAIHLLRKLVGLKRALRMFDITHTLYRQWAIESQFDCFDSWTALCTRRHPHQLSKEEINDMKQMLKAFEFDHWPIVSVQSHGLRTGKLIASLYSWYKYARLLGITKKPLGKQRKTKGIQATRPNEYWHVDSTYFPLMDGTKVCIAFCMDNYSKMILGYHLADKVSFAVVKEALRMAVKTISTVTDKDEINLIADGGSENHNKHIHTFLKNLVGYKVTKLRALKDIKFSNSPVEAVNRTVKGFYLKRRKFESISALKKYLDWIVKDYNEVRPHYKHRPYTPNEIYRNIPLKFDPEKRKKEALKARLKVNKHTACMQCESYRKSKCKPECKPE